MRTSRRTVALATVLVLLAAACSRSGDSETTATTAGGGSTETTAAGGADDTALDNGGFGDLAAVCSDGDASGATDVGVTDTEIHIGTVTDKGFTARQGLNREMFDTAVAFAAWCNDHGGILGRQVVVDDRDAQLTAYNDVVTASCTEDLALAGGGAVLDDSDNGSRVACGLPIIPGYVVSAQARVADLQVQPLPNPVYQLQVGQYRVLAEQFPDAIAHYGIMTGSLGSTLLVRDTAVEAVGALGYDVVYNREYNVGGESDWRPFAEEIRDAGVKIFEFVGEPGNLALQLQAKQQGGYFPDKILESPNIYDTSFKDEAAGLAPEVLIRSVFTPFELASDNKAVQDYLDLMAQYNPDGKIAQLGVQAMSSLLLFAQSAKACGSNLTRACLLEQAGGVTEWTAGGLHAASNPSANTPPDCFTNIRLGADGFSVADDVTDANQGIFNCDPANVAELSGDYGVPR
jgi:hypothetical protein